ncbi:MAG TPA: TraM recognition domain-containing protein, partial [Candidatus Saccharimonadales bacterium]
ALSTLDKEDGAGIQILMRPADPVWRKNALSIASSKRKGEGGGKKGAEKVFGLGKEIATAFVKPPEAKDSKGDSKNDLSSLDQAIVDSIEDKTRNPGYEVLIRVVVSSNISQRSQAILNNIVAAFSLYDAPGKNGLKFSPTKDIDEFTTSYILRMFPQTANKCILNSVELATIFHFPEQKSIPTSQLERQGSKQVDAPRNMPDDGLLLGYNVFRGVKKPVRLSLGDRQRHMYTVGQTGTGKSTYLENLALQDMLSGGGFAFVDPHGDTAEKLLSMVPRERTEDIIYFSPSDVEYPMGLNLFEYDSPDEKDFLIQEVLNMLYKLYDPQHQGIMGPRYEHLFRNAALTVMADPAGGTFVDIPKLFRDPSFVKQKLKFVKDQNVLEFWQKEMPQSQRSNEFGEVVSWFVSKFGAFLSNEMMRNIIGQTKSAFNLREVMDEGKILIVNLSKGRLGMLNSQLLGMIFVMKFQAAAMSRANVPESERKDFALYVDEFQNFSTDSFATILSEARKYHLNLIVANQFTTQLTDEIRDAVFGNTGTIVAFRVGQDEDAEALSKRMRPAFDATDLLRMPNYNAAVRMLVNGVPTQPFSMATLPPLGNPNSKLSDALKQLSAAKYGRPKALVEKEILERLYTKPEPVAPARQFGPGQQTQPGAQYNRPMGAQPQAPGGFGATAPNANRFGGAQAPMPQPAGTGSFLDEWMSKRQTKGPLLRPNPWSKANPGAASGATSAVAANRYANPAPSASAQPVQQPRTVQQPSIKTLAQSAVPGPAKDRHQAQEAVTVPAPQPQPKPEPLKKEDKTSGEIPLFKESKPEDPNDTIFIDQEGNLHMR